MKLKVFKRKSIEIKTDLEFPVYLYFQDELSNDTLIKVTEKEKITIKYGYGELSISVESNYFIEDWQVNKRNITTEKHFMDSYQEALKTISYCVVP